MCCTHLNYLMLETHIVVSGDANFSMKRTSLTVGGSINPMWHIPQLSYQEMLKRDSYGCSLNLCMLSLILWSQLTTPFWK